MSEKTDAWMPLWIGAYLADTQHLTRDEHGGYFLLLMAYWRARAALPDDDKRLASIVKASPAEWRRLRPTLAEFFVVKDGVWWHKRVEAEIESADKRKATAVSKAQAAAGARWGDRSGDASSNAPSIAPGTPQAMLEQCPTPSPISTSLRSVERGKPRPAKKAPESFEITPELRRWAREHTPAIDVDLETAKFRDHTFATSCIDWPGRWRNWLRKAVEMAPRNPADVARVTVPFQPRADSYLAKLDAEPERTPEQKARDDAARLAVVGKVIGRRVMA
jgi:uncharacterized protein YdaU (DUF1376 family)